MTFVNEIIPEDDKIKIDWGHFRWSQWSEPHRPWKWTIDRGRDVFLVMLVGQGREGDHPEVYALSWKGDVIRFKAERDAKGMFETGVDMFWKVFDIEMPIHLEAIRAEIYSVLREAIDAHGSIYKREHVKSVSIVIL